MAVAEEQLCPILNVNYAEVIGVGKVTFGEHQRNLKHRKNPEKMDQPQNKKSKSKAPNKDTEEEKGKLKSEIEKLISQATNLTQTVCALLNSGGGVIRAKIENEDYSYKQHRIGLDIEDAFRDCIQHKEFHEYFDFQQEESCMLIFVKSWSSENSAYPRVCSLNMGLYERSSSSTVKMKLTNVVRFLQTKKDDAQGQARPALENVQNCAPGVQTEKDINDAVAQFFERDQLEFGEILDFTESTMVEFKDLPRDPDKYKFVRNILPRYASAFANTKGGYLIFGVDNNRKVVGCKRNIHPSDFQAVVRETIGALPVFHFCDSEGKVEFLCKALPVYSTNENGDGEERGYVFAVRI